MSNLNEITRRAVLDLYYRKGIRAADAKIKELLVQCETQKGNTRERSTIKGELSEIALECHLLWWMQRSRYMMLVKSLCVKSLTSNATAETDLLLATPCKVYMFECKSFKGRKMLTKECYLKGESSEKDVFDQSKYHMEIMEQHLHDCHISSSKIAPYQLILFELSSEGIDDQRDDKWKRGIPLLTLDTIDAWFQKQFSQQHPVLWDFTRLTEKLRKLDETSDAMFKFHLKKIFNRRG